ncbi:MAG: TIGR02757 family protein [Candidatus Hydrogenedentota bacterium]
MTRLELHRQLRTLYSTYNDARYIHPDPLEFVHHYDNPRDQEVAGLIAALLAYGRVAQILTSIEKLLSPMGASPYDYLTDASEGTIRTDTEYFRHRWTTGDDIANLLLGMKRSLKRRGSLEASFASHISDSDETTLAPLSNWVHALAEGFPKNSLLSDPARGSACKRLHLYLRWMVRSDQVDPGPWKSISPKLLVIPLDTHMYKVAKRYRMTRRKAPDGKAALDMTKVFRKMEPEDPLKFDFVLTRLGIRAELSPDLLETL